MTKSRFMIILSVLLSLNMTAVCRGGDFDDAIKGLAEAVGKSVVFDLKKRVWPDMRKITAAIAAFQDKNDRLPKDYPELVRFAEKNDIDLKLKSMEHVQLTRLDEDALAVDYNIMLTATKALSKRSVTPARTVRQRFILKPNENGKIQGLPPADPGKEN